MASLVFVLERYQEAFFCREGFELFFFFFFFHINMKKLKNLVRNELFRQITLTLTLPLDVPLCRMDAN